MTTATKTSEARIRELEKQIFAADEEALLLKIELDSWKIRVNRAYLRRSRLIEQWERETGGSWADLMV